MKRFFVFFLSLFILTSIWAQTEKPSSYANKTHAVGFNVGGTTGLVFSYRYMPKKWGVQIALLPSGEKGNFWGDAGLTFLYNFYTSPSNRINLFNYLGNSVIYQRSGRYEDTSWNLGLGYGIDIRMHERISFGFMLGWGVYDLAADYTFLPDASTYLFFKF